MVGLLEVEALVLVCVVLRIFGYCDEKSGARIIPTLLLIVWEWNSDF